MNWQKLNDVDTYMNLWNKFKGLFHRNTHTKEDADDAEYEDVLDSIEYESDSSYGGNVHSNFSTNQSSSAPNNLKQIDLGMIFKACGRHWYLYIIWCILAFALACFIILPIPRYYKSTVKLAPEISGMSGGGSLGSIAQQFGVDISKANLQGSDAIIPDLYPDLIKSVDFQVGLFNINVQTINGDLNTTYYDYLLKHQKISWIERDIEKITNKIISDPAKNFPFPKGGGANDVVNPSRLTRDQFTVCNKIGANVSCEVDKKTSVISIEVTDQDPLISTTMADSVRLHLQKFITKYRTQKAQNDLDYALRLQTDAKKKYEKARREYADYSDAHQDVVLQEFQSKTEDLENEMQLRYNSYTAMTTQVQAAQAKLREQTPAFTTLQSATVPIKPAGPKRMVFCAVFVILAAIIVSVYSFAKENSKKNKKKRHRIKKHTFNNKEDKSKEDNEKDDAESKQQ